MHVNKTIETKDGTIKFEGELEQNEADLVIKIGLNYLLQNGALPIVHHGYVPGEIVKDEEFDD